MDQLITRVLNRTARPEEMAAVQRWRLESLENEARYREIAALWQATERPAATEPQPPRAERIIDLAERRRKPPSQVAESADRWRGIGRAAVVASLIVGAVIAGRLWDDDLMVAIEVSTGPNEFTSTRLSEGTSIRLAPSTTIRVDRIAGGRQVWLQGRAFFSVTENPSVPFVVRTDAGEVVVLGTRFQVDAQPDELGVLVVDGRVKLETTGGDVEVATGQRSRVSRGERPYVEDLTEIRSDLAWMEGLLVFHDTPFVQVATEIEARYGVSFPIPDGEIGNRTVSASFTTEDLGTVLSIVCRVVAVQCTLQGSTVTVGE